MSILLPVAKDYAERCGRQSATITIARIWAESALNNIIHQPLVARQMLIETIERLAAAEKDK